MGRETLADRKDGTTFPIHLAIGHTKLPQDDIFVGLISDILERIMIENSLRHNEEQLKSFIQNIQSVVYRCLILNAAPMHDVGKIGIPDSIIQKQGKQTEEEWPEEMERNQ